MSAASSAPTPAPTDKPGQFTAMISSTSYDLPEHRAVVEKACLAAGIFPLGMEHLPTRDASGTAVSLEMVDKADLYIGIYAWRYGWVPEGREVSVTEMEFDRALERQKEGKLHELLIFTAHEDHPFTKRDIETGDVPQQKLAAFKARASKGRVRKQFVSAQDLHRLVAEALSFWMKQHHADRHTAPPPPPFKITNNLPRQARFFGRQKELEVIAKALLPQTRSWGVLIDGPGGMGKTSLAVHAADLAKAQFDRVLFLTTKSQRLTPEGTVAMTTSIVPAYPDILNELGQLLGLPHIEKSPEAERAARIKTALQTDKVLLIFDNLENLENTQQMLLFGFVEDLPPGCKAIVTSRRRSDVDARIIRLEKLEQDAALKLLKELATDRPLLAKASKKDRLHLYAETGGNPLLLRWVVGQLGRGSCRTVEGALALCRMAGAGEKVDPLEFIFGDLLETFTEEETKALAALTYFTQKVAVKHIVELADLSRTATQTALADLANRALVMPDETEEHFALVPMVADFLREKRPQVVEDTGDRLKVRAFALIVENGYRKHDCFHVLDAAWPNVAPAMPRFLAGPNQRLQEVCAALLHFLDFTGRWDEALEFYQQAETCAVAAGNHAKAGWRAHNVGWFHLLRRQGEGVLDCAGRAAAHWARAFPPGHSGGQAGIRERAFAVRLRGLGHRLTQNYSAAFEAFREAQALFCGLSAANAEVAMVLNDLADTEMLSGHFAAAEKDYREALEVARREGDTASIALYIANLADLALDQEKWEEAEGLAREALPLAKKLGRQNLIADVHAHLAKALVRQGNGVKGRPHARRAVEIYISLGSPDRVKAEKTLAECV
ncbi:MAG TPA: DUF4062 domain-containing protein [Prosthecobacter sp.]